MSVAFVQSIVMMMTQGSYTFGVVVEPIVHSSVCMVNFVNNLVVVLVAVSYLHLCLAY